MFAKIFRRISCRGTVATFKATLVNSSDRQFLSRLSFRDFPSSRDRQIDDLSNFEIFVTFPVRIFFSDILNDVSLQLQSPWTVFLDLFSSELTINLKILLLEFKVS
jgi:hypothetical protein